MLVSRLRTGHVGVNRYLIKVGKRKSSEYECGEGGQSVRHVLEEYRWGSKARERCRKEWGEEVEVKMLLYKRWIGPVKFGMNLWQGGEGGVRRGMRAEIWKEMKRGGDGEN